MTGKNLDSFKLVAVVEKGVTVQKVRLYDNDLISGDSFGEYAKALTSYPKHHVVLLCRETFETLKQKGLIKRP